MKACRFVPVAVLLAVMFVMTGCQIGESDTMSVEISWSYGNCDLGIREPDGRVYWVTQGRSVNGVFSFDRRNGGTERWTLQANHDTGAYTPMARSIDYNGELNLAIFYNGKKTGGTLPIRPGETLVSTDFNVKRSKNLNP